MRGRALLPLLTVVLSGCSLSLAPSSVGIAVSCEAPASGNANRTMVLAAQTVPTATLLPCVRLLPAGWSVDSIDARRGKAQFTLRTDRNERKAVTVTLAATCDVAGATAVPSDQAGARRYERPRRVQDGYRGDRYYLFTGGCVTYRFNVRGSSAAETVNNTSLAVDFVSRESIRSAVRHEYHGRVELDPGPLGEG